MATERRRGRSSAISDSDDDSCQTSHSRASSAFSLLVYLAGIDGDFQRPMSLHRLQWSSPTGHPDCQAHAPRVSLAQARGSRHAVHPATDLRHRKTEHEVIVGPSFRVLPQLLKSQQRIGCDHHVGSLTRLVGLGTFNVHQSGVILGIEDVAPPGELRPQRCAGPHQTSPTPARCPAGRA